jgi:hypothetical protein
VPAAATSASPFPDLPDSGQLPKVDSSSWLPPVEGLDPMPVDDDFPPFMPPLPPMEEPEPPRPTLSFAGMAASAHQPKSRVLPLAILGLLLALAAAAYLFRDTLKGLLGGDAAVASAGPERPPVRPAAPPPSASPEGKPAILEEEPAATPLPEVVRRKEPEPTPAPVSAPAAPALRGLERITWEKALGGTDVILWGDGAIPPEAYFQSRIGNPPRELIKLVGIARPFPTPRLAVGTDEVKQVRTGYHQKAGGNELHVVIDLADPGVKITRIDSQERQLRIHLQRP